MANNGLGGEFDNLYMINGSIFLQCKIIDVCEMVPYRDINEILLTRLVCSINQSQ